MKRLFFPLLFLLLLLCVPASAGTITMEDTAGENEVRVYSVSDPALEGILPSAIDYTVSGENIFYTASDDVISKATIGFDVKDNGIEVIPFTLYYGDEPLDYEINISKSGFHVNISIYCEDEFLTGHDYIHLFSSDYFLTFGEDSLFLTSGGITEAYDTIKASKNWIPGTWEVWLNEHGFDYFDEVDNLGFLPANGIKINLDRDESTYLWMNIKDDSNYQYIPDIKEDPLTSIIMGVYSVVTIVIPDNNHVLYDFCMLTGTLGDYILVFFGILLSVPFMYLFFAGVCSLAVFVLNGSFRGGTAAGIRTFMKFISFPFNLVKSLWHLLMKIIEAILPI
jgi:hypothetical protein